MPSPTDINFIVIEIQNEERRHFPALQKPWQSSGPETYGRIDTERYTYFDGGKWRLKIGDTEYSGDWVNRLAAYEETRLEPEDMKKVFNEDATLKLAGQILGVTPGRLRELAQADREGRVKIDPKALKCPKCGKMRLFPRIDWQYYYCYSCKTQFPREAAEAALKEREAEHDR